MEAEKLKWKAWPLIQGSCNLVERREQSHNSVRMGTKKLFLEKTRNRNFLWALLRLLEVSYELFFKILKKKTCLCLVDKMSCMTLQRERRIIFFQLENTTQIDKPLIV